MYIFQLLQKHTSKKIYFRQSYTLKLAPNLKMTPYIRDKNTTWYHFESHRTDLLC